MTMVDVLNDILINSLCKRSDNSKQLNTWPTEMQAMEHVQNVSLEIVKGKDGNNKFRGDAIVFFMIDYHEELSDDTKKLILDKIFNNYIDDQGTPMYMYCIDKELCPNTYLAAILSKYDFDIDLEYQEIIAEYLAKSQDLMVDEIGFFLRSDIVYIDLKEELILELGKEKIKTVYDEWKEFVTQVLINEYHYPEHEVANFDVSKLLRLDEFDHEMVLNLEMLKLIEESN